MKEQKLIAIAGPSASGKTHISVNLAKEINGEIISVDSRQIYKELNIGSAKPSMIERQGVVHHLLDVVSINDEYSAANFCDDAQMAITEILEKGKVPVLAGGTGLYFRILLQDFDLPRVAPDKELRKKLEEKSSCELYKMLFELDPVIAGKIHQNNKVKIIRALEVCKTLNIPMSEAQKKKNPPYKTLWFGLNALNRNFLYDRVNKRVDTMMEAGLLNEAENLFQNFPCNKILLNTIGYQEFYPYIQKEITLEDAVNTLKQNTRRYVKRQISWFNANKDIKWFDIEKQNSDEIIKTILLNYNNL